MATTLQNPGFEANDATAPTGWTLRPEADAYAISTTRDEARTGNRSLEIQSTPTGKFGAAVQHIDAAPLRGKRVRLHVWVKVREVTGMATPFLRVDGGECTYAFSKGDLPVGTTTEWREVVVDAEVCPGSDLVYGVTLLGTGQAWFDDLSMEILDLPALVPIHIRGAVADPAGGAVASAEVALIAPSGAIAQHVTTETSGRFDFAATSGTWGISAHAPARPDLVGTFLAQAPYPADRSDVTMTLPATGGVTLRGQLTGVMPDGGVWLQVARFSTDDADVFAVAPSASGAFTATLPDGERYAVGVLSGGFGQGIAVRSGHAIALDLDAVLPTPAPPAVVDWIAGAAVPLLSVEPGSDRADLVPLGRMVGDAHVVALGEGTHGTREFSQVKHRVIEHLVADHGFSVVALEIGQVEARTINAYVVDGRGAARASLGDAGMWVWETEEVLALIEWMRAWNRDPTHTQKVTFAGFDLQNPAPSLGTVRRYLTEVAPDRVESLLGPLVVLGVEDGRGAFVALSEARRAEVLASAAGLVAVFDDAYAAWTAAAGAEAFDVARHDAEILNDAAEQFGTLTLTHAGSALRDRAMADNVLWLLGHEPPGTRVVLWAHNAHVADSVGDPVRMGHHLRAALGPDLVTFGLELGSGTFQALRRRDDGVNENLEAIAIPPAPPGYATEAFARVGLPAFALDLRTIPESGPVAAWLRSPLLVRDRGYRSSQDATAPEVQVLPALYDALLYVDSTTRARPLPVDLSRSP